MADFITLSCPTCGGKLRITSDINRFACQFCGAEHIVRRGEGIVSISPVVEGLGKIQTGVDKTASELAIHRLRSEIAQLQARAMQATPDPKKRGMSPFLSGTVGLLFLCLALALLATPPVTITKNGTNSAASPFGTGILCCGSGLVLVAMSVMTTRKRRTVNQRYQETIANTSRALC